MKIGGIGEQCLVITLNNDKISNVEKPGARYVSALDCEQELLLLEGQHPLDV